MKDNKSRLVWTSLSERKESNSGMYGKKECPVCHKKVNVLANGEFSRHKAYLNPKKKTHYTICNGKKKSTE